MLRESRCLAAAFLVVALLAATAGTGVAHAADLSWLSAPNASDISQEPGTPSFMWAKSGIAPKAMCTASCGSFTLSCTYTPPGGTCSAADRNCAASPQQPGFVQCGTAPKVYCTPECPPPPCTEGQTQLLPTGFCCQNARQEFEKYQCVSGQWDFVGLECRFSCPF